MPSDGVIVSLLACPDANIRGRTTVQSFLKIPHNTATEIHFRKKERDGTKT